jgi:hypothetical protein
VVANLRYRLSGIGPLEFDFLDSKLHPVIAAEFETVGLVERDKWSLSLREAVVPDRKRRTIEDIGRG